MTTEEQRDYWEERYYKEHIKNIKLQREIEVLKQKISNNIANN